MDARRDPESSRGAIKRVPDQLGVHPEALRNRVRQGEGDGGVRPGTTTEHAQRLAALEREVRELCASGLGPGAHRWGQATTASRFPPRTR